MGADLISFRSDGLLRMKSNPLPNRTLISLLSSAKKALVFLLLPFLASSVSAQDGGSVNLRFRTYSVNQPIKDLRLVTKGGSIKVDVPGGTRSKVMGYRGEKTMVFFKKSEQVDGEPMVPLAKVTLKEGVRNPLLIFIQTRSREKGRLAYQIKVIDDHPKNFPNGSMKFINLTQRTLYLIAGQKDELKKSIKPGGMVSHQLPKGFKGNLPVKIAFKTAKGAVPVMHSRVFPNQSVRDLYFIWPIPKRQSGHKVRISTLRERGDVARMRLRAERKKLELPQ